MGGIITAVQAGSVGAKAGLRPGDVLLSLNGCPVRDVIDVQYYGADEYIEFLVSRDGVEIELETSRDYTEALGLEFSDPTFDSGIQRCDNRCEFCFVAQMPPGLRRSLYIRDDDYRYSFLYGSYVTLTNLTDDDWERIADQFLSPLYVSVHASDVELRRRVLRRPEAQDVMEQLRRLAEMGIEVHTQLVLVPGLNDGPHLERSIEDLAELYPAVRSISVVPVGLTRFHRGGCRPYALDEMRQVMEQVLPWQERFKNELSVRLVHLSDEWYLRLGEQLPPVEDYDGLDLTENGVGLVRRFLDAGIALDGPATLVTGELFAPLLQQLSVKLKGVNVVAIANHFMGETVTVAGLLAAQDVLEQLRGQELGDLVILPAAMFGGPEGQSLDEMFPQDVEDALGRRVATRHTLAKVA